MPVLERPRRRVDVDYGPRDHFKAFHERSQRFAVLVCHRRAGKTVATLNDLLRGASSERKRAGRYAFIAPLRNQAKDIAWRYLKHYAQPLMATEPNESELRINLVNGSMLRLYGADNPDALRGPYLDGVVLDEFADMRPEVWYSVVRPMLADRHGWAVFIGTPKGKNEFFKLYNNAKRDTAWFSMLLKASESGIISAEELAELHRDMGDDLYDQEFECSFEAALKGAFYAEEMRTMLAEGRIAPIAIDKAVRVHTAWDLGISDSTAIWFIQCVGRERRLVDYYESSGVALSHYTDVLQEKRKQYGWKYGEHFFPHDVAHRELSTGKSRVDTLRSLGIEAIYPGQPNNLLDGINATRKMLGRIWIDPQRCERGLEALRQYRREYDERLKDWKTGPMHDWASHGADGLRTFAEQFDEGATTVRPAADRKEPQRGTHWSA